MIFLYFQMKNEKFDLLIYLFIIKIYNVSYSKCQMCFSILCIHKLKDNKQNKFTNTLLGFLIQCVACSTVDGPTAYIRPNSVFTMLALHAGIPT